MAHRLVEIELYFHSSDHPDPFAHCDPLQASKLRWYFHRVGTSYRGGSFKGIDLTFGGNGAFGGILIRSLEAPNGTIVVGPSLCVDHLLSTTGHASAATLDAAIAERSATDVTSPLHLVDGGDASVQLFRTARVGLSLKRFSDALAVQRLDCRYRFLTEPKRVTKGRTELIDALLEDGRSADEIRQLTGSPMKTIAARTARR